MTSFEYFRNKSNRIGLVSIGRWRQQQKKKKKKSLEL